MALIKSACDWLFQRPQVRAARDRMAGRSDWTRLCFARSKACLSLSDSIVDALDSPAAIAPENLGLCRQACQWILDAEGAGPRPVEQALAEFDPRILDRACAGAGKLEDIRKILLRSTADDARLAAPELEKDLAAMRAFARALCDQVDPEHAYQRAVSRAVLRTTVLVVALAAVTGGVVYAARNVRFGAPSGDGDASVASGAPPGRPPAPAEGGAPPPPAPGETASGTFDNVRWRTSSKYADCLPAKRNCGGVTTDIFFHTREEESAWIEFDLNAAKQIREVRMKNRSDYGPERAVPLVIEVSMDQKAWEQVAQRNEVFDEFTAKFEPKNTRYVRLRKLGNGYLHLEGVWIR